MLGQAQPAIDQNEALLKIEAKRLELQRRSVEPLRETIEKAQTTVRSGTTTIDRQGGSRSGGAAAANIGTNVIFGAGGKPVVNAPGAPLQAPHLTPKQAQEANDKLSAYRDLQEGLVKLRDDLETGAAIPLIQSDKRGVRKTRASALTGLLAKADKMGALDKGVEAQVKGLIGGEAEMITGRFGAVAKLNEAIAIQDMKAAHDLEQLGIQGVKDNLHLINGTARPAARPSEQQDSPPASSPPVGAKDSPEDVNSDKPLPEDPGAEELPEAKKVSGRPRRAMNDKDRAAVALAKERLKKDPNNSAARRVLERWGVEP
jgi:hypothetical protein